jgi:hypothetical protein
MVHTAFRSSRSEVSARSWSCSRKWSWLVARNFSSSSVTRLSRSPELWLSNVADSSFSRSCNDSTTARRVLCGIVRLGPAIGVTPVLAMRRFRVRVVDLRFPHLGTLKLGLGEPELRL